MCGYCYCIYIVYILHCVIEQCFNVALNSVLALHCSLSDLGTEYLFGLHSYNLSLYNYQHPCASFKIRAAGLIALKCWLKL